MIKLELTSNVSDPDENSVVTDSNVTLVDGNPMELALGVMLLQYLHEVSQSAVLGGKLQRILGHIESITDSSTSSQQVDLEDLVSTDFSKRNGIPYN